MVNIYVHKQYRLLRVIKNEKRTRAISLPLALSLLGDPGGAYFIDSIKVNSKNTTIMLFGDTDDFQKP